MSIVSLSVSQVFALGLGIVFIVIVIILTYHIAHRRAAHKDFITGKIVK